MATVISKATGNWSSSSTWALVDSTSYLDSESTITNLTASFQYSQTFTPGAITIDGVAVKVFTLGVSNTIDLDFYNNTDAVSVTTATVNTSDLKVGWNFFKFASSQTLIAGKAYKIGLRQNGSTVNTSFSRNATAANWSRLLRTTTTQSPVAGDQIIITGELTGAGTSNAFTVTMDNTSTTLYGNTTSTYTQSIAICNGGTLTFGTSASTNYYLKWKGAFDVQAGGTLNVGTSGTRIPSTSTAVLEMGGSALTDTGIRFQDGSTSTFYGKTKQRWTKLTADVSAAGTTLNVTSTSGWAAGDTLVLAGTNNQATQTETATINTVNSGTQVTLNAGVTYAHTGTGVAVGEVGNITSNVIIRSASSSLCGVMWGSATSIVTMDNIEIYYVNGNGNGSATTLNSRGLDFLTTTGSLTINNCGIHDLTSNSLSAGARFSNGASDNYTITNNCFYNCNYGIFTATTSASTAYPSTFSISGNLAVGCGIGYSIGTLSSTYTNNVAAGCSSQGHILQGYGYGATVSGNVAHSCLYGFDFIGAYSVTSASLTSYYNNVYGCIVEGCPGYLTLNNCNIYGNGRNLFFNQSGSSSSLNSGTITVANSTIDGSALYKSQSGLTCGNGQSRLIFDTCTFGASYPHSLYTISVGSNSFNNNYVNALFRNCTFTETTLIQVQQALSITGSLAFQRYNGTSGDHRVYYQNGTSTTDTTLYKTASPSLRLAPTSAPYKFESAPAGKGFRVAVSSGSTATVSVWVRKSVIGDGTAYNGNQPRLRVRANSVLGISSDTTLATASGSAGSWEQLSGTTSAATANGVLEFYVDCDGTAGWINIDDFGTTTVNDTKGLKYYSEGVPAVWSDNTSGSGGDVLYYAY